MTRYSSELKQRISRHREFYARREPGDLLVYINGGRNPSLESFLCAKLHERGDEATLPNDAVFVNGDPVGLISREQAETFDRPSIEKLFTHTGGGFFHNHTVGLYQVDLVSSYRGILVQWFVDDPKQPSLASALLDHPDLRKKILAASLQCPVAGWVPHDRLEEFLDIARQGRFILSVSCPENMPAESLIRKVRTVSNIK